MSLRRIDIEECHGHLLRIAESFDRICREHDIPYFMLGGTMLGAVRHEGFIPWDDDMDFGIPRPYFDRFIETAREELPECYSVLTRKNSDAVKKGFIKIQLKGSKVIEKIFEPADADFYSGIAIDVFPLDGASTDNLADRIRIKRIFWLIRFHEGRFCSLSVRKGLKKLAAAFIKALPIDDRKLADFIDRKLQSREFDASPKTANYYGHWKEREIIDSKVFKSSRRYTFQSITLAGVEDYDTYLRSLYGDYMQLPPKEQQITHADNIFIEESAAVPPSDPSKRKGSAISSPATLQTTRQ